MNAHRFQRALRQHVEAELGQRRKVILMLDLGKHAVFIWASYGAVAVVLASLIFWLINDGRRQQRILTDLDAMGVRRRSAKKQSPDS